MSFRVIANSCFLYAVVVEVASIVVSQQEQTKRHLYCLLMPFCYKTGCANFQKNYVYHAVVRTACAPRDRFL